MKEHKYLGAFVAAALIGGVAFSAQADGHGGLVKYEVVMKEDVPTIPKSLTGKPGDPKAGKKTAVAKKKGHCIACHKMPIPEEQFHGDLGPDLGDIAARMEAAEMRARIVDPKLSNADTIMPAFYRTEGLNRVMKKWQGKTLMSAQEVEDVIAYLQTLKGTYPTE